jgi:hypothetical protein
MSNLPDDYQHAAFVAAFEHNEPEFDDNARAAQAMVSLASMAGMDWTEASQWLAEETYQLDDAGREALAGQFDSRLETCLDEIRDHIEAYRRMRLRQSAKFSVVRFIQSLDVQVMA